MGVKGLIGKFEHKKREKKQPNKHIPSCFSEPCTLASLYTEQRCIRQPAESQTDAIILLSIHKRYFYIDTALLQKLFRRQGSLRSSVNSKNISLKNPIHTSNCLVFFLHLYEKGCQHLSFKIYSVYSGLLSVGKS